MLPDAAPEGGGPAGTTIPAFPTLPPGTPGYAIALVAVAVIVVAIVWFAAKFVKPRDAAAAPPATSSTATAPAVPAAETDYRMARETIDRLEKKLEKAEVEQDAMRAAYDRQVERNHELEKQLLARDNTLASARDEIATLRASLSAMQRPWGGQGAPGSQYVVPPPPLRAQQPRRPPTHDVFDPEAPTDPLDTYPPRPGAPR